MGNKTIRIGGASGYWGDSAMAPRQLVEKGAVDYLVLDYLAEVTMAVLAKQRQRAPDAGYATDFVTLVMQPLIKQIAEKRIKVIANAGGINVEGCRKALEAVAAQAGVTMKIATVSGDDLMPHLMDLKTLDIREMGSGQKLPDRLLSANAYLGAFPIAQALNAGADVVVTGRCVDSALVLGLLIHEFGWRRDDYDRLAAGSLAGHLIECGAQATGGNFTDWRDSVDGWDDMGYPIAEVSVDGSFAITKPPGTGGVVSPLSVGEQLLYEIGDPAAYMLPDVVCDFTQVRIVQQGPDRVQVSGARGLAPTDTYKVSATYAGGYGAVAMKVVAGFDAAEKARADADALLRRTRRLLTQARLPDFSQTALQIVGAETLYGHDGPGQARAAREVMARLAVRHDRKEGAELFAREYVGTGLSMTTGKCGIIPGRPTVSPIVRLFSFLVDKAQVEIRVEVDGRVFASRETGSHAAASAGKPSRPAAPAEAPPGERTIEVPLVRLAVARSGDKGNDANIGVMARRAEFLPFIRAALTPEAVKRYFAHVAQGPVQRYELPGLNALNFVLKDSLGGGGTSSTNLDIQGKTYAQLLLGIDVAVPERWANELGAAH
ncbi:MAG: acyclic terpene utilization AtuA family protein [Rhodospirillales bacterium]